MSRYFLWLIILLLLIVILFGIDVSSRYREIEVQMQIEQFENEQKISHLEKEIRLLKQDVYILQHGYEGAIE